MFTLVAGLTLTSTNELKNQPAKKQNNGINQGAV
jgi:hypothetical protein